MGGGLVGDHAADFGAAVSGAGVLDVSSRAGECGAGDDGEGVGGLDVMGQGWLTST